MMQCQRKVFCTYFLLPILKQQTSNNAYHQSLYFGTLIFALQCPQSCVDLGQLSDATQLLSHSLSSTGQGENIR